MLSALSLEIIISESFSPEKLYGKTRVNKLRVSLISKFTHYDSHFLSRLLHEIYFKWGGFGFSILVSNK